MKKTLVSIVCIITMLCASVVYATNSFNARIETNSNVLTPGLELEAVLKLENFNSEEKGIDVLLATLVYDKTIFEEVTSEDIITIQNWSGLVYNKENGALVVDAYTAVNTAHNALKVNLKVKEDLDVRQLKNKTVEIRFKDISASDGEQDIYVQDATAVFQVENSIVEADLVKKTSEAKVIVMIVAILGVLIVGSTAIVMVKRRK